MHFCLCILDSMKVRILLTSGILAALLCGCADPMARYKVLSFFFDGVPNPQEEEAKAALLEKRTEEKKKRPTFTEHGPFAAKECQACHMRDTNRLVAPIEELCFRCHKIDLKKGWTHGPVASGGCRVCHNPHSSGYPFLLIAKPSEFCFYCHKEKDVSQIEAHRGATAECTTCHDAHSADNKFLLK